MTYIKICGIKTPDQALAAAKAGADYIGMVFTVSPRQITPAAAKKITAALKKEYPKVQTVGVFVNTPSPIMQATADNVGLDWVQMHGTEPWEAARQLDRPIIKVLRVARNYSPGIIIDNIAYGDKLLGKQKHMFMLDTSAKDKFGGTGKTFDWKQAKAIAEKYPVIVAGGLSPDNVAEAIATVKPWGVDVSTGVETSGAKDMKKVEQFIKAVRQADAS